MAIIKLVGERNEALEMVSQNYNVFPKSVHHNNI